MKKALSTSVLLLAILSPLHHTFAQNGSSELARKSTRSSDPASSEDSASLAQKYYESGVALYEAGKLDSAIDAFKQAIRLKPEHAQAHYGLGMALSKSSNYKDAAESYKRAVRYEPEWPEAHFRLGWTYYVLGKVSQSREEYNKLLKLNSPLATTLYRIIRKDSEDKTAGGSAGNAVADSRTSPLKHADVVPVPVSVKESSKTSVVPKGSGAAKERSAIPKSGRATKKEDSRPTSAEGSANPAPSSSSANPAPPDGVALTVSYKVGMGDVLDIRLLNSMTGRSTLYTVGEGGLIDFPLAGGTMAVSGLTTDEIQTRLVAELKRRAVQEGSQVTVGVRQYASHTITITGLVSSPGAKILRREAVPIYVVLAEVQPRPDAARATIMRANGSNSTIDLTDSAALKTLVRPGDVINVTSRPQEFYYIGGRINYPGQKVFQPGITLLQAILAAGGLVRESNKTVELSREGADGRLSTTKFDLKEIKAGKMQDPRLQPGDRIEVVH